MTQRPSGQLHHRDTTDLTTELEAYLRATAEADQDRLRRLHAMAAECVEGSAAPIYRSNDDPRHRELIDRLRARTRSQRRADHAVVKAKRRTAATAAGAGLLVLFGLPAVVSATAPDAGSTPAVVASSTPSAAGAAAASTPMPTATAAPGTLVRGTTDAGEPIAVVIPAPGPSWGLQVFLTVVSTFLGVLLLPVAEWLRRRLRLPGGSHP